MAGKADSTPAANQADAPDTTDKAARQKAIEKAKYDATRTVVDSNKDQWNSLVQSNLASVGIDWTPPLTAEQKAEQQLQALLSEFPHLRDSAVS